MILVVVDSRIRIEQRDLLAEPALAEKLRAAFSHRNWKRVAMQKAKIRGFWNEPLVIATWHEDAVHLSLPRGGMTRVREILKDAGVEFRVLDRRAKPPKVAIPDTRVSMWPHQERIIQACLAKENCLVKSGTGSGKTSAILGLAGRAKLPTLVVVHSTKLLEQWVRRAIIELGMKPKDVGTIGGGKPTRVRALTIGVQKSVALLAARDPEFVTRWGMVVADEVHLFAASTFFASIDPFHARYRIGVSDDEKRKDKKEFLVHDLFGERACEVTDAELVDTGRVMAVEVMVVPTEFEADWYGVPDADDADDEKRPDYPELLNAMANDPDRNAIVDGIFASELAEEHQIIVFGSEREHCRSLGTMAARRARSGYLIGGPDYSKEFDRTAVGLCDGSIRVGVGTYKACGTGIDLPGVGVGIAATPCLGNKSMFRQAKGRVCRKPEGKTVARLYVLWDRRVFGLRHLANAASWNPTTYVWDAGEWKPAKAYLKQARAIIREKDGG
jgi:superfamily II DNA or RNA helicase